MASKSTESYIVPDIVKVAKLKKSEKASREAKPKVVKERKQTVITSTNHKLPTVEATADLETLQELKKIAGGKGTDVDFNGYFRRQNKFGGFEFSITQDVYNAMVDDATEMGVVMGKDPKEASYCIGLDDYTGHYSVKARLSKDYIQQHGGADKVPVPEDQTLVHVEGRLCCGKVMGKDALFFQISNLSKIAEEGNPKSEKSPSDTTDNSDSDEEE